MNSRTLEILEYNKILNLLADQAGSDPARERILELVPVANERAVNDALTETTEAVSVIVYKGPMPVGEIEDVTGLISMARKGRSLSMRELLSIRRALAITREVKTFLSNDIPEGLSAISEISDLLSPQNALEQDIDRCILSEDEMSDNASPALRDIRREIRNKNAGIRSRLNRFTSSGSMQKYLQDAIVTIRNGRYVIPVKKEYASLVPGMVHDQSGTGATLFIEPTAIVNMNNELKELMISEDAEIRRILGWLSGRVQEHGTEIENNQALLISLDVINAKGKLSCAMDACAPRINTDGRISIKGGRHPLISADKVVPIDVSLGDGFKTLLITGPNTGGKTVTLKTIGLFILMAESGLHLPANDDTEIPIIDKVFADIGDEQSIEQSLSTFSAHMKNIVDIFDAVDEDSLVLLDELGAGTDPIEGAALGISELEKLREKGALVAATTHYTELKKYALSTPMVENASMEFDIETLSPTYKLRLGLPGKSNAFEIAAKLGLHDEIITRASELMDEGALEFEGAVTRVEEDRKLSEEMLAEAHKMMADAKAMMAKADAGIAKTEARREEILEEARAEAREILRDAQDTVDEIRDELKSMQGADSGKIVQQVAESRRKLREEEKRHAGKKQETVIRPGVDPEDITIGLRVKLVTIDQNGEVETLPDERGNLQIRVGAIKMNANVRDLMIIENKPAVGSTKKSRAYSNIAGSKARNVRTSINVIGKNLDDALAEVDKYIDDAYLAKLKMVTIVHGKGEGILKTGIRKELTDNKHVKGCRPAPYNEGGEGATIVELND